MNRPKEPHAKDPRKLESGRWQARVTYYAPKTGKRHETSQTFATEREAKKWSREEEQRYRVNPTHQPPSEEKVGEFFDRWLQQTRVGKATPGTVERYGYDIRHIQEHLGNRTLAIVGPQEIYQFYQAIFDEGLAAGSIENIAVVLRAGFKWAVKTELLSKNPTDDISPPRPPATEHAIPAVDEVLAFLALADEHRLRGLWIFLVLTGVRIGEALGLRWTDIDWQRRGVLIQRALKRNKGPQYLGDTKGHRARQVALSKATITALQQHRTQQDQERLAAGPAWDDTWQGGGWVFLTQTGQPLSRNHVHETFKRLAKRAGLPKTVRMHDLRHTMATYWLSQGVPVKVVSERLGHSRSSTTMDIYAHVLPGMQAEAADMMDAWLTGPRTDSPEPEE